MVVSHSSLAECLRAVAQFYQCGTGNVCNPSVNWAGLLSEAKGAGLVGEYQQFDAANILDYSFPAIAYAGNGKGFVLAAVRDGTALIHHPANGRSESVPLSQLTERWSGEFVVLQSASAEIGGLKRFDFTWFVPALVEHRKALLQIIVAAFALQIFALIGPLIFQAVMDKVLLHRTLHTLDVLVILLVAVAVLESTLALIRTYTLEHIAAKMDSKLGCHLYHHLLALPLAYFQARRCGHIVARLGEVETLREFLSAQTLGALIDTLFFAMFSIALFYLSPPLAAIVLGSLPLYVVIAVWLTPHLRQRLELHAARSAEQDAFLLETLRGIDTLKTLAAEPQLRQRWATLQARALFEGLRAGNVSTLMQEAVSLIGKLTTAAVLGFGAWLVITSSVSLGQLIAFNLLATRVSQPVQRLAQLWVHLQRAGLAMHRLTDVLDTPREDLDASLATLADVTGHIEFRDVSFSYGPGQPRVLEGFNLTVGPGEVVGIQGPSGCGKSTLALLLQKLYVPERGQVLIDGQDLATVAPASIRKHIGIVMQDSVLLSRTVRENIAINDPGAPLDSVITAARLAGAHEFILKLSRGYDTLLQEGGSSLSGGQRQRIALARALFANPRILIMDEATSALDAEAEQHILNNMPEICKGRTVLIIAHKAQALKVAGKLVSFSDGRCSSECYAPMILREA